MPSRDLLGVEVLRALSEGSAVITYGSVWVKVDADRDVWGKQLRPGFMPKYRDSGWLAKVATRVIFDVGEWRADA